MRSLPVDPPLRRWVIGRPEMVRTVAAVLLLLSWVLLPGERTAVLTVFGGLLLAVALVEAIATVRLTRSARLPGCLRAAAPAAAGVVLLLGGDDASRVRLAVGVLLAIRGLADALAAASVDRVPRLRRWLMFLAGAELALAAAALAAPDLFGPAALVTIGFVWLGGGLATSLVPSQPEIAAATMAPVPGLGPMADADRERIAEEIYFDHTDIRARLVRFVVLLTAAAVIATYGVLADSVAAVIGAMIVAPLMVPIQALAAGVVAGAARRALAAAAVVLGGMVLVLVVAMLIAATSRDLSAALQNAQVQARTSPALTDLAIALAAGAAGGFALVRTDVAGSLPGVAIAVSLVPPLCVCGAALAGGANRAALGAFLLFAINLVAIVVAVGAVLLLAGFGQTSGHISRRLLTVSAAVAVVLAGLALPLATTGRQIVSDEALDNVVRTELTTWLGPNELARVLDLRVNGDTVDILITSGTHPPPVATLQNAVRDATDRPVTVHVLWLRAENLS